MPSWVTEIFRSGRVEFGQTKFYYVDLKHIYDGLEQRLVLIRWKKRTRKVDINLLKSLQFPVIDDGSKL